MEEPHLSGQCEIGVQVFTPLTSWQQGPLEAGTNSSIPGYGSLGLEEARVALCSVCALNIYLALGEQPIPG